MSNDLGQSRSVLFSGATCVRQVLCVGFIACSYRMECQWTCTNYNHCKHVRHDVAAQMMMMSQIMSERDCLGWLIDINHFTSLVVLANSIVIRIQDGSQFKLSVYTDIHPSYNNLILLSSLSYM